MHILQVTLGFYPAQAWGGPVKIVHQNGRELVRRGHQVTVYCTNLLNKRRRIRPGTFEQAMDGMRVVYFETWRLPWWPGTLGPIWLPDLSVYLKQEMKNFDIVHLNGYRNLMLLPIVRAALYANRPVIMQPHGAMPVAVNSLWLKRVYDRLFGQMELSSLSALIAGQDSERRQALAHGVPGNLIEIIPNGIDPEEQKHVPETGIFRRRFGLKVDQPLILFLGRINKKKGTDMLVEAFSKLNNLEAQLAIVGPDDGQLAEVQELVRRHRLEDRVFLPGLLTGSDVLSAFQDADLFVLPCRTDTFPFAIIEACLAGTPMVITDRCEIAHLVKDRVADVVPFDAHAFAVAIKQLLTDRQRYERYRTNCLAVLTDTFSIRTTVDRLEAVYNRTITEKR